MVYIVDIIQDIIQGIKTKDGSDNDVGVDFEPTELPLSFNFVEKLDDNDDEVDVVDNEANDGVDCDGSIIDVRFSLGVDPPLTLTCSPSLVGTSSSTVLLFCVGFFVVRASTESESVSRRRMIFAGVPTAVAPSGTGFKTIDPAPILTL